MPDTLTPPAPGAAAAKTAPTRAQVAEVADTFVSLMRAFGKARARLLAAAENDLEWSAHVLLRALSSLGPVRASELADCVHSDPSTVSRQVAALVKDGLLERRADPEDGRASLLVLTPRAGAVLAEHDEIRVDFFARVFDGWTPDELADFTAMLTRFTAAYETATPDFMTDRVATRLPARPTATRAADPAAARGEN